VTQSVEPVADSAIGVLGMPGNCPPGAASATRQKIAATVIAREFLNGRVARFAAGWAACGTIAPTFHFQGLVRLDNFMRRDYNGARYSLFVLI
jgi:hypothetical protein